MGSTALEICPTDSRSSTPGPWRGNLSLVLAQPRLAPASVGTCIYLLGFAVPFHQDWPLIMLAVCALFSATLGSSRGGTGRSPLLLPVAIFAAVQGLTVLLSDDPLHSATLAVTFLPAVLLYVLLSEFADARSQLQAVLFSLSLLGVALSLAVIAQAIGAPGEAAADWASGIGSPIVVVRNDLILLALIAPFASVQIIRRPRSLGAVLGGLCLLLSLVTLVLTLSRGGVLIFVSVTGALLLLLRPRLACIALAALFLLAGVMDLTMGFALSSRFASLADPRIALWLSAWGMFLDAPLLGHGLHSFGLFYPDYFARLELPSWVPVDERFAPWAHNLYLEVLAEQGLLGLAALLILLGAGMTLSWRLRFSSDPDVAAMASALVAALTGFCLAAAFELSFIRIWVTVILFTLLGLVALLARLNRKLGS